jgi:hypothetical protein
MATDAENIATRRSAILTQLAAMTSLSIGNVPTYSADGQMVDHVGYRKSLIEEYKMLGDALSAAQQPTESFFVGTTT